MACPEDWSTEALLNRNGDENNLPSAEGNSLAVAGPDAAAGGSSSTAEPVTAPADASVIGALDREILKTLVKIQRLSTSFRMASTAQPPLRQWRQSLYVETNSGCTIAGTIDSMRLNYPNIHRPATIFSIDSKTRLATSRLADPRRIRPALSQGVQEPQVIGNFVNLCGDVFELGSNAHRWLQLKEMGLDSKTYRKRVLELRAELDAQMAQRNALERTVSVSAPQAKILVSEGRLQRDLRDLILIEYGQYHSSAIKLHWFQNAAYVLDFAKNGTGASGGIISIEGNHLRHPKWTGAAALLTTISGTMILVIPFAGRVAGNWAGTVDRHIVNHDYGHTIAQTTADAYRDRALFMDALEQDKVSQPDAAATNAHTRLYAYTQICDIMKDHEVNINRFLKRAKSATIENVIYASITGSTKVTLGITGMIAGWHYYKSPWMASRLQAAGNTAYTSGTAFSLLENARVLTENQITHYQLQGEHLLPSQIYKGRLQTLETVERKLNGTTL